MGEARGPVKFGKFEGYLEDAACPLGHRGGERLLFRGGDGIGYYRCSSCGVMFASPRFTEESMMRIYETEAFADFEVFKDWSYNKWKARRDRTYITQRAKAELVGRYLDRGSRVLDVGTGFGLFVVEAVREGFLCEGIEPSSMLSRVAREVAGADVRTTTIEEFDPPYRFDGIVIWDVLEHLYDPLGVLRKCNELLGEGGYLFAQVPNYRGAANSLKTFLSRAGLKRSNFKHFGFPWHVYAFDRRSLGSLMEAASLEPLAFESWSHAMKEGRSDPLSRALIGLARTLCLSDYIVGVARKAK